MSYRVFVLTAAVVLVSGCNRESAAPKSSARSVPTTSFKATAPANPGSSTAPVASGPTATMVETKLPSSWRYAAPTVVRSARGMVVTDSTIASEVGKEILAAGGSAVDAAIAVAFALCVVYPTAGNIGGGGFAIAHVRGESRALDFREVAPAAATRDMYRDRSGAPSKDAQRGVRSAGVPGSVAGLWELHRVLGSRKLTWEELLRPAIRLAQLGFPVDEELELSLERVADRLRRYPSSTKLFFPGGVALRRGSTWRNPELAQILRQIADRGPDGFYRGSAAAAIVAQMRRDRGWITHTDLERYQPKWREPLRFTYRGATILTMPPPSSGGITLAMIANILSGFELAQFGFQDPRSLHLTIEAMRRAFAARNARIGDPDFVHVPTDELLGLAWANEQRATILRERATPSSEIVSASESSGNGPHTTHFAVGDAEGDAIALTTTLNFSYGSGVVVDGAGFVLNNEMDDFASIPGKPNGFGLVQGEANAIAPFKRMLSSMSPSIVFGPDERILCILGAAGGPTIISSVFQQLSNLLDFGVDMGSAVAAPRVHMQHLPDVVALERGGFRDATIKQLEAMGHRIEEREQIADAPMLGRADSVWFGIAEPRRQGSLASAP